MNEAPDTWPRSSVLVEVELPDPGELPPLLVDLVGSLRVVLLGSYALPEQTAPEQARDQMEEELSGVLEEVSSAFRDAGADVEARMVFTPDPLTTAARVAREESCDAVLLARPLPKLERVLVPLRGAHNVRPIAAFLAGLLVGSDARVTFLHVVEEEEEDDFGPWVVEEARDLVVGLGVPTERIETRTVSGDDPAEIVLEEAGSHDVLVLGESEPEAADLLFGTFSERVASKARIPVFVIRRRH